MTGEHSLALDDAEVRLLLVMTREYAGEGFEETSRLIRRIEGLLLPEPAETPAEPPAGAVLLWQRPMLGLVTTQGSWVPEVELVNQSEQVHEQSGPMMATARLHRPDGTPVISRQKEWPMPAMAMVHRLAPGQTVSIRIAVMLLEDEIAALEPGFYRLADVSWGALSAPDKDVRVD